MNDQLTRIIPLATIILLTIFFSPFVNAQDYEITPNLAFPQLYINSGNVNSGYTLNNAVDTISGIDWRIIIPIMMVAIVLYGLWRLTSREYEEVSDYSSGYQVAFHDIRKEKRSGDKKQNKETFSANKRSFSANKFKFKRSVP